jgi:putative nucleotidyltransferase with HDIG domain
LDVAINQMNESSVRSFADNHGLKTIDTTFNGMDFYTRGHARRVSVYAMRLARRVGLEPDVVANIGLGGLLHDIGKASLSERIFKNTKATLSSDMLQEVRRHPLIGVSILKGIDFLTPVIDYVLYHHERVDGSGYPCGLIADEIPLGAKIISVADCFDAITTNRSYQKGKNKKEAFAILKEAGFCPGLVEAFITEIEESGMAEMWPANRWEYVLPAFGLRL